MLIGKQKKDFMLANASFESIIPEVSAQYPLPARKLNESLNEYLMAVDETDMSYQQFDALATFSASISLHLSPEGHALYDYSAPDSKHGHTRMQSGRIDKEPALLLNLDLKSDTDAVLDRYATELITGIPNIDIHVTMPDESIEQTHYQFYLASGHGSPRLVRITRSRVNHNTNKIYYSIAADKS